MRFLKPLTQFSEVGRIIFHHFFEQETDLQKTSKKRRLRCSKTVLFETLQAPGRGGYGGKENALDPPFSHLGLNLAPRDLKDPSKSAPDTIFHPFVMIWGWMFLDFPKLWEPFLHHLEWFPSVKMDSVPPLFFKSDNQI